MSSPFSHGSLVTMLLPTALALVLFVAILVAFRLRHRWGLGLFHPLAGGTQFVAALLLAVTPSLTALSPATLATFVLAPAGLLAVLLLYLREDVPYTRSFIAGTGAGALLLGALIDRFGGSLLTMFDLRRYSAFTASFVLSSLLLVVLHEFAFFKLQRAPGAIRLMGTGSLAAGVHAATFSALGYGGSPAFGDALTTTAVAFLGGTLVQAVPLLIYLQRYEPSPLDRDFSRTTRMLDVFSIVTYRERYQVVKEQLAAAEAANLAKSRFLAHMSHELRTPLNAIISLTHVMIADDEVAPDESRLYLERIHSNGEDLLKLINGLLDLSKIESGRTTLEITRVDPVPLIHEVIDQLRGTALEKDLELSSELPDIGLEILADRDLLKQVLVNLIGNAIKFTEVGRITARVVTAGARALRIEVEDTGIGIPPDKQELVFEAFEQADPGIDRVYGGTGLGLAISRAFCHQMGFDLTVTSRLHEGSTFAVVLAE